MTRFPLLPFPAAAPAECVGCKAHADPVGFIDLGVAIEYHGALYLCASRCLAAMLAVVGAARLGLASGQEREATVSAERALASALAENAVLRSVTGGAMLKLLHDVTLESVQREMEGDASADGGDAPGGGAAGGGDRAGGDEHGSPAGGADQPVPGADRRPPARHPRGRAGKAAQPAPG